MKRFALLVWLLLPVLVAAYHFGPGQDRLIMDNADQALRSAWQHAEQEQWADAVKHYERALQLLPKENVESIRQIRLERAKAQMLSAQLPEAREDLRALVAELSESKSVNAPLLAEARSALASSLYYSTWLMRLEGQPKEVWEPEIESARQIYRLLAEQREQAGDVEQQQEAEDNLESAIRLARMDLKELQGLPLPQQ